MNKTVSQLRGQLQQAEADIESLMLRVEQALPVMVRVVEDAEQSRHWKKDILKTIHINLTKTIEAVKGHQKERKEHQRGTGNA
jgi:hypothetical protein